MSESTITITEQYLVSQGLSENFPDRFWKKVNKTDLCWLWTANRNEDGYGTIRSSSVGPIIRAHQASWILNRGPIPKGMCVCHNCPDGDNPACVNPNHLWLGTPDDNAKDRDKKGRCWHPKGESVKHSKLNDEKVRLIRQMYPINTLLQLGNIFGVSSVAIRKVVTRKSWNHVD